MYLNWPSSVCVCVCACGCVCVCVQSMEEILHCYSKEENPELNRQIEFIIKQLNSGQSTGQHQQQLPQYMVGSIGPFTVLPFCGRVPLMSEYYRRRRHVCGEKPAFLGGPPNVDVFRHP